MTLPVKAEIYSDHDKAFNFGMYNNYRVQKDRLRKLPQRCQCHFMKPLRQDLILFIRKPCMCTILVNDDQGQKTSSI